MPRNYDDSLREITQKKKKYSEPMQVGADEQKVTRLQQEVKQKLLVELPDEYICFLRITDGLDWNGLVIYSSETSNIDGYEDRSIPGILETNLLNREEDEFCNNFLFFGCSGIDAYALKISTGEYQILDRTSLDLTETFDLFDDLISEALKSHL